MKKSLSAFRLNRDTLRQLDGIGLIAVEGGTAPSRTIQIVCDSRPGSAICVPIAPEPGGG